MDDSNLYRHTAGTGSTEPSSSQWFVSMLAWACTKASMSAYMRKQHDSPHTTELCRYQTQCFHSGCIAACMSAAQHANRMHATGAPTGVSGLRPTRMSDCVMSESAFAPIRMTSVATPLSPAQSMLLASCPVSTANELASWVSVSGKPAWQPPQHARLRQHALGDVPCAWDAFPRSPLNQ